MDDIEIVEPDRTWPRQFETERGRLEAALSDEAVEAIEHFGSTAVAGLPAKPIIDILIAVPSVDDARQRFPEILKPLGYVFWPDNPKRDRLFFVRGMPPFGRRRTHHIHVTERPGELWQRLRLRDYLRAHRGDARRYADLKRRLAAKHASDREAYTDAKRDFIAEIMKKAQS